MISGNREENVSFSLSRKIKEVKRCLVIVNRHQSLDRVRRYLVNPADGPEAILQLPRQNFITLHPGYGQAELARPGCNDLEILQVLPLLNEPLTDS